MSFNFLVKNLRLLLLLVSLFAPESDSYDRAVDDYGYVYGETRADEPDIDLADCVQHCSFLNMHTVAHDRV